MKVFELMQELAKYPAGADVKFRTLMTLAEFATQPVADTDADTNKDLYQIDKNIEEVEGVNDSLVAIYS